MNLTTRIAIRHLRSRHSFGFISFSTIFSVIGLAIGIASLIIISCISRGFSEIVNYKLSAIDGHIRINNYASGRISIDEISRIDSCIQNISSDIEVASPYIEKHAIIRNGSLTEGIILYGVEETSLSNIFQLHQFTTGPFNFTHNKSIIIGRKLALSLDVQVGDDIMIMNIEKMAKEQILHAEKFIIINIFQTDFPEYDRLLAFIPLQAADIFFEMNNDVSGLILNVNNADDVESTNLKLSEAIGLYPYMTSTWKERHSGLLQWLTLYDIPIKIIMAFITFIGIFNIAASLWMIVIEKTRDFGILKTMGLNANNIMLITIKEGAFIGLISSLGGIILSAILLYTQITFHFIKLSNDIYFMDYLPVQPSLIYFIIYPLFAFVITIGFSYYPALYCSKISPSEALHYE